MSGPCTTDWMLLKKMARYLRSHPTMVNMFEYQPYPKCLDIRVDTDSAGCKRTRKSTDGGMAFLGKHLVKSWATTQTVIALSSGEAEHYGQTKGSCEGLGIAGLVGYLTGQRMQSRSPRTRPRPRASRRGAEWARSST